MDIVACVGADVHPRMGFWTPVTSLSTCPLLHSGQALLVVGPALAKLWTMGVKTLCRARGPRTAG